MAVTATAQTTGKVMALTSILLSAGGAVCLSSGRPIGALCVFVMALTTGLWAIAVLLSRDTPTPRPDAVWGTTAPWGEGPTQCVHCLGKRDREVFYDDETAARNLVELSGGGGAR